MTPEQLTIWRRDMHARLDALSHRARVTRQTMEANEVRVLTDRADISATWASIVSLFPEDFQPIRGGDLARHLSFSMQHDFYDIEYHDIPAIKASVDQYRRAGEENAIAAQADLQFDLQLFELVHPLIRDACFGHLQLGHYEIAARSSVELIMAEVRRISVLQGDGAELVNRAFGEAVGQLRFSEGVTANDGMINRGLKTLLTGCYTGIRNPLAHGGGGFSRIECIQILMICSFLLGRISVVVAETDD